MSSKAHFICEGNIEGYEETIEPVEIFGKFQGFNLYFYLEFPLLNNVTSEGTYLKIQVNNNEHMKQPDH